MPTKQQRLERHRAAHPSKITHMPEWVLYLSGSRKQCERSPEDGSEEHSLWDYIVLGED